LPVVLITHHLPSEKSVHPKYKNNALTTCFATNLDYILKDPRIKLVVHGHTHVGMDYFIDNTRVVCNPRGYIQKTKNENEKFCDQFIIEI
jgi:predicted phosphodiesterase